MVGHPQAHNHAHRLNVTPVVITPATKSDIDALHSDLVSVYIKLQVGKLLAISPYGRQDPWEELRLMDDRELSIACGSWTTGS